MASLCRAARGLFVAATGSNGWGRLCSRALVCVLLSGPVVSFAQTQAPVASPAAPPVVRVAAVGGLVLSGVWPRVAEQAGTALGLQVITVAASPKEGVVPVFARGDADVLLIHASDEAMALEASALAAPVRVWAWNEHVLVGPNADPAQVRSAGDGQEALRRIARTKAPFIAFRDPGSYTVVQRLWRRAGIRPDDRWAHIDTGQTPQDVLQQAAAMGAYAVVGHIPVAFGKMAAPGIEVLLQGDPIMRRPYVVLTPGPRHPADAKTRRRAEQLADYLVSAAGQAALVQAQPPATGTWLFGRHSVPASYEETKP